MEWRWKRLPKLSGGEVRFLRLKFGIVIDMESSHEKSAEIE